jgi:hypothetical protein
MTDRDRVQLLFGPYQVPPVKRGDRAFCFVRDREMVITGWSDAPLSWPRGYARPSKPAGGAALLVDDELAPVVLPVSYAAKAKIVVARDERTAYGGSGLELLCPDIETHQAVITA